MEGPRNGIARLLNKGGGSMEKEGKKKRIGMSKALEPDEFVKAMEEIESEV